MAKTDTISSKEFAKILAEPFEKTKLYNGFDNAFQTVMLPFQFGDDAGKARLIKVMAAAGDDVSPKGVETKSKQLWEFHRTMQQLGSSPLDWPIVKEEFQKRYSTVYHALPENEKDPAHGRAALETLFGKLGLEILPENEVGTRGEGKRKA